MRPRVQEASRESDAVAQPMSLKPIGIVRSALRDRTNAANQAFEGAPEAVLEIEPEFAPALHRR